MRSFFDVKSEFEQLAIPTQSVEFYNLPEFIHAEKSNPALLESYAEYVALYPFEEQYLNRARQIVPFACRFLREELLQDGKLGACLDFVQAAMKILEQLDIWCVAICGSLTIEFDADLKQKSRHWAHVFEAPAGHNAVGHAWLFAPPYKLIDMTIGRQHNTEDVNQHLPEFLITEETVAVEGVALEDMLDIDLEMKLRRDGYKVPTIQELMKCHPAFARMMGKFRPFSVRAGQARLKYFPCTVGALEEEFSKVTTQCFRGQTAPQLLEKIIDGLNSAEIKRATT